MEIKFVENKTSKLNEKTLSIDNESRDKVLDLAHCLLEKVDVIGVANNVVDVAKNLIDKLDIVLNKFGTIDVNKTLKIFKMFSKHKGK